MREPNEFDGMGAEDDDGMRDDEEGESDDFDEMMSDEEEAEHDELDGLVADEEEGDPDEFDEMRADEEDGEQEIEEDDQPFPFIPNGHAIIPRDGPDDPLPVVWVEPETFGKGWLILFAFTVVLILGIAVFFIYNAIWGDGLQRKGYRKYHIDF